MIYAGTSENKQIFQSPAKRLMVSDKVVLIVTIQQPHHDHVAPQFCRKY